MADYVAYHKVPEWGEFLMEGGDCNFFSGKHRKTLERMLGHSVWVISGDRVNGSSRYHLCARFTPDRVRAARKGHIVIGEGTELQPHIDVTEEAWFRRLFEEQNHFRYGLNRIRDPQIVIGLESAATGDPLRLYPDEVPDVEEYVEGAKTRITMNAYERDAKVRRACIEHRGAVCAACELKFSDVYGEIGEGFIHVHHTRPLAKISTSYRVNPVKDLIPVCPNCHAMLHRREPPLTVEELRASFERISDEDHCRIARRSLDRLVRGPARNGVRRQHGDGGCVPTHGAGVRSGRREAGLVAGPAVVDVMGR